MLKKLIVFLCMVIIAIRPAVYAQEEAPPPLKAFEPFKMVFLPDINLSFSEKSDKILFNESLVIFQDVIKTLNNAVKPNFVVFGGDLTYNEDGKFTDLPMFLDTASDLDSVFYAIMGDREANLDETSSKEVFMKEFGEFDLETAEQTFWVIEPVTNVLLIGLDTSMKNDLSNDEKPGYLNLQQLFWLDTVLDNNRDKFTIITMHHSAIKTCDFDNNKWERFTLSRPSLFLELLSRYPQVKLVLSGHHYNNYAKMHNGTLFMSFSSITVYPNTYKALTIHPDRVEVDNRKISFKQIIKKAEKLLAESEYAKEYSAQKPRSVLKFHEGEGFSRKKVYSLIKEK
ncbi:MAG: hypothetical protein GX568_03215 [Candidatus Gastranaerophilales bacterium]|jgi:3',5'-cyclic AMP phosphodiesterase CpdA|nr:hypothetical protein [Candidatus Gastranaerophilales bacterium]